MGLCPWTGLEELRPHADHGDPVPLDSRRALTSRYYSTHTHGPALNSPQLQTHFHTTHQHISALSAGFISVAGGDTPASPCFHHMMVPRTCPDCCTDMKHLSAALRHRSNKPWCTRDALESARHRYAGPVCCTRAYGQHAMVYL